MKKLFAVLLLVALALPVFADDAQTLPAGVLRTYITTAYAFGDQGFNPDGDKVDAMELKALNLGTAIEYGVNDWISAGIQWAPGWNVWSETDYALGAGNTGLVNGIYDLFVGAKIQVVGSKAPISNDKVRFAVTPGVKIPLGGADFTKEYENILAGEDAIISDPDKHAWAVGGRASFDYVINEMFFANLFCEYIKYFEVKDALVSPTPAALEDLAKADYAYGYTLKLEAEPHFETPLGGGKLGIGVPVSYSMWPATEKDGVEMAAKPEGYSLSISPSASYFFMAGPLPLEVKLGYTLPLMGESTPAYNTAVFQLKSYLKF
ncbi:MAG TPA: hypothetical protein P5165_07395 [Spirochaetia bacterium]|nr:hypothetical protein [Spirochaetia bacterium]